MKFVFLVLLIASLPSFAEDCETAGSYADFEKIMAELQPQTSVKVDLLTDSKIDEKTGLPHGGLVSFVMEKEFVPPTQERFDQIVRSLSSEPALNELDHILEVKRDPPLNIMIKAHSSAPDKDGKYVMKTDTWIEGFQTLTSKQSLMNCTEKNKPSSWSQSCEIDLKDPATVKYVSSGNRVMGCELILDKKIVCTTKFSAHPRDLDLPFIVRPVAKKVAGTTDLSASQLAYKTVQRSLSLILALHEFAEQGGDPSPKNLKTAADSAFSSVFHNDLEEFVRKLPKKAQDPVSAIHYSKKISE